MRKVAIIQARQTSTRLPNKVMKIIQGKPMLWHQIKRVKRSLLIDEIVVATTKESLEIIKFCEENTIAYTTGDEKDVLARYYQAALEYKADVVIRLTSDCPLIDSAIIDETIAFYRDNNFDYVSNTLDRTYARGMDTEVFGVTVLKEAYINASLPYEREHVTPYIYLSGKYNIGQKKQENNEEHWRLTVDTIEDFSLINMIYDNLYKKNENFDMNDIRLLIKQSPEILEINSHIKQKELGE